MIKKKEKLPLNFKAKAYYYFKKLFCFKDLTSDKLKENRAKEFFNKNFKGKLINFILSVLFIIGIGFIYIFVGFKYLDRFFYPLLFLFLFPMVMFLIYCFFVSSFKFWSLLYVSYCYLRIPFSTSVESYLTGIIYLLKRRENKLNLIFTSSKGKYQKIKNRKYKTQKFLDKILKNSKEYEVLVEFKKELILIINSMYEVKLKVNKIIKALQLVQCSVNKQIISYKEHKANIRIQRKARSFLKRSIGSVRKDFKVFFDDVFKEFKILPQLELDILKIKEQIFERLDKESIQNKAVNELAVFYEDLNSQQDLLSKYV